MIEYRHFNGRFVKKHNVDMTPLIDIIFQLFIFFLLTSSLTTSAVPINLPESDTAEAAVENEIHLILLPDRTIIDGNAVTDSELLTILKQKTTALKTGALTIQADRNVPFGRIIEVMDTAKKAGISSSSFLVERTEERNDP